MDVLSAKDGTRLNLTSFGPFEFNLIWPFAYFAFQSDMTDANMKYAIEGDKVRTNKQTLFSCRGGVDNSSTYVGSIGKAQM